MYMAHDSTTRVMEVVEQPTEAEAPTEQILRIAANQWVVCSPQTITATAIITSIDKNESSK